MSGPRPLEGLRVIELGQLLAGPFAGTILGYFGAEVIKVEPPTGDPAYEAPHGTRVQPAVRNCPWGGAVFSPAGPPSDADDLRQSLAEAHSQLFASVGVHPDQVEDASPGVTDLIERAQRIVATRDATEL